MVQGASEGSSFFKCLFVAHGCFAQYLRLRRRLGCQGTFCRMEMPESLSHYFSGLCHSRRDGVENLPGEGSRARVSYTAAAEGGPDGMELGIIFFVSMRLSGWCMPRARWMRRRWPKILPLFLIFTVGGPHTVHVDNVIVASSEREKVAAVVSGAHRELEGRGLLTHEADMGSSDYRALGFSIGGDPAETRLTKKKWWTLYHALRAVCDMGHFTSKMVEVLVGHITIAALLRCELLSALRSCYD